MPRYFFDIEAEICTVDEDGTELADYETAAIAALRIMLDVARLGAAGKDERQMAVVVRNEAGTEVYRTELTIRSRRWNLNGVDHIPGTVRSIILIGGKGDSRGFLAAAAGDVPSPRARTPTREFSRPTIREYSTPADSLNKAVVIQQINA